jgi:hypothetical protein
MDTHQSQGGRKSKIDITAICQSSQKLDNKEKKRYELVAVVLRRGIGASNTIIMAANSNDVSQHSS